MENPKGTIIAGIKYKDGVLLFSDSLGVASNKRVGNIEKIFQICDNVGICVSGDLGYAQYLTNNLQVFVERAFEHYDNYILNYEKKLIETMEKNIKKTTSKEGEKKLEDIKRIKELPFEKKRIVLSDLETMIIFTPQNVYFKRLGKKKRPNYRRDSLIIQKYFNSLIVGLESIANWLMHRIVESRRNDINVILGGYDRGGAKLFEIYTNGGVIKKEDFAVMGCGKIEAKTRIEEFYKPNLKYEEAMILGIYACLKAADADVSLNKEIQCIDIKNKDRKISSKRIGKKEIENYKKICENLKARLHDEKGNIIL